MFTGFKSEDNDMQLTAAQFINSTSAHIFLTGKAGTGKTTFLKNLSTQTHKQFTVVAPTGIAALNAGGVTIHSQFLLPLGTFLPVRSNETSFQPGDNFYTQDTLARKHPLNSQRKQVLRSIDLLVIDEVSMLRADLLDAIDYRLKSARGNFRQSFGGVQLLMIGDLFQLPPVVKRSESTLLKDYYPSAWFYDSLALKADGFTYIELDKIFRQKDESFIRILNNLRNNALTPEDVEALNSHFKPSNELSDITEVITLTTHNYKADEMNRQALKDLPVPSHYFRASIEGEFPENMYPVLENLELKEGAQIMFVRNDNDDQMYFNGKLATITEIKDDVIEVMMADSHELYELKKERWENKRYSVNATTKDLEAEVIGSFEQYPIKLAWAITVHKSQGLTFEKAIIDVEQAFADGQVYVALSRLRSLDGLILRTKINPSVVSTDHMIVSFTQVNNRPGELYQVMKQQQFKFISQLIDTTFEFEGLVKSLHVVNKNKNEVASLAESTMQPMLAQLANLFLGEKENTNKFRRQLHGLLEAKDVPALLKRVKQGSDYYKAFLWQQLKLLLRHIQEMRQHKRVKTYLNSLSELDQSFMKKLEEVDKSLHLIESILQEQTDFNFTDQSKERLTIRSLLLKEINEQMPVGVQKDKKSKKGSKKKDGPSTYDITLQMIESGMDIEMVAKERGLVPGTIEGHLAKAVGAGRISILKLMTEQEVKEVELAIKEMPEGFTSKDLFVKLDGRFGYGKLRAVMNHLQLHAINSGK